MKPGARQSDSRPVRQKRHSPQCDIRNGITRSPICQPSTPSPTAEIAHIRSLLFAPGSDEGKLLKAFESGADAVVADLEDAVAPGEQERAREVVALLLRGTVPRTKVSRIVRLNGAETSYFEEDL